MNTKEPHDIVDDIGAVPEDKREDYVSITGEEAEAMKGKTTEERVAFLDAKLAKDRRGERILKWFEFAHLPETLKPTSHRFYLLAEFLMYHVTQGPERTAALRKLLEAKDAAVRATVHPGG